MKECIFDLEMSNEMSNNSSVINLDSVSGKYK